MRHILRRLSPLQYSSTHQRAPRQLHLNSVRNYCAAYDGPGKTTVSVLNQEVESLLIDSYSVKGFRLNNDMKCFGPIIIFPDAVLGWKVRGPQDITVESLTLFRLLDPKPELIVLGVGESSKAFDPRQFLLLRKAGFNVEAMPTEHAVSTYNYLCAEERLVAAALIPPDKVSFINEYDLHNMNVRAKGGKDIYSESGKNWLGMHDADKLGELREKGILKDSKGKGDE